MSIGSEQKCLDQILTIDSRAQAVVFEYCWLGSSFIRVGKAAAIGQVGRAFIAAYRRH